jgi:hypothetical protein
MKTADQLFEENKGVFDQVLILGFDQKGKLTIGATEGLENGPMLLWLIEQFKAKLLNGNFTVAE